MKHLCEECGEPATSEPPTKLCFDCLWELACDIGEAIWALLGSLPGTERPEATARDKKRMICLGMIALGQRMAAEIIAEGLGAKIAWRPSRN